jgi:hypothetical protein
MTFTNYLKKQLTDFIDSYSNYFGRTLGAILTYTVLCFVAMAVLLKFSDFDTISARKQSSLLSFFFTRYSANDTYSLIDLAKIIFIFFVSLYSVGLFRLTNKEAEEQKELPFTSFLKELRVNDLVSLVITLIICSALDFGLIQLDDHCLGSFNNQAFQSWFHSALFFLRVYVPMVLFSISLYKLLFNRSLKLNFKKLFFLFVSLWFFNEFAFEISLFVRIYIFGLLLSPLAEEKKYLYESFLGIMLVGFYFVGYYSAMVTSLKLHDVQEVTEVTIND